MRSLDTELKEPLTALQGSFNRAAQYLKDSPLEAEKALAELASANEILCSVMRLVSGGLFGEQQRLEALRLPLSRFGLNCRALNVCTKEASLTLLSDDGKLPVGAKLGIDTVAELVQLTEKDLLLLRCCGRTTVNHIKQLLADRGLSLGMSLSDDEIKAANARQVVCLSQLDPHVLTDGRNIKTALARDLARTRLEVIFPLLGYERERIRRISVRNGQGEVRPISTVGELVQLDYLPGLNDAAGPRARIANLLFPAGLCLYMTLSDEKLAELGSERVSMAGY